jgi:hypothetical protein
MAHFSHAQNVLITSLRRQLADAKRRLAIVAGVADMPDEVPPSKPVRPEVDLARQFLERSSRTYNLRDFGFALREAGIMPPTTKRGEHFIKKHVLPHVPQFVRTAGVGRSRVYEIGKRA